MPSPMALLVLLVACVAVLVPPTTSTRLYLDESSVINGFRSTLRKAGSDTKMSKIEHLQLAVERGSERMRKLDAKRSSNSRLPHHDVVESTVRQSPDEYLMNLSIGTPMAIPLSFPAIIDTGSNLVWTQCQPCVHCLNQSTPIFDPAKSSSFSKLTCHSNICSALPSSCGKHGDCVYEYSYGDLSSTRGVLATETFTFEGNASVPELGFGCAFDNKGDFGSAPAVVGLGRGKLSLVSQMNEAKFSYCLPTFGSNETGVISMGGLATTPPDAKTTPLIKNPFFPSLYYLSLQGITIGETLLPIDNTTFAMKQNGSGGLIIDSGTTVTYLEASAFDQVLKELIRQLKRPTINGSDFGLDLCYNITSPIKSYEFPKMVFHFEGGGYELTSDNYIFVDTEKGIGCLAMKASPFDDGMSIFGNFQQQNTLVVYDLAKDKLSFITNKMCDKLM